MANEIHRSKVGTYHPAPLHCACGQLEETIFPAIKGRKFPALYEHDGAGRCAGNVAWTIHDSRGTIDGGPACDKCGACECEAPENGTIDIHEDGECSGLSFAYVCLDGGETLCDECAEKAGLTIVDCDCA